MIITCVSQVHENILFEAVMLIGAWSAERVVVVFVFVLQIVGF